jgi:hypothetical protein
MTAGGRKVRAAAESGLQIINQSLATIGQPIISFPARPEGRAQTFESSQQDTASDGVRDARASC